MQLAMFPSRSSTLAIVLCFCLPFANIWSATQHALLRSAFVRLEKSVVGLRYMEEISLVWAVRLWIFLASGPALLLCSRVSLCIILEQDEQDGCILNQLFFLNSR